MDNVNALKAVYVALGGDAADVADIASNPRMIEALAAAITAGGIAAQLPTVSAADAGKVLTVSAEGKWAAAALPGG